MAADIIALLSNAITGKEKTQTSMQSEFRLKKLQTAPFSITMQHEILSLRVSVALTSSQILH